jgi:23S rRNA pseudouridine1911/1915/1917 synthase
MKIPIIYEDNHFVIVNKPSGIVSQPNSSVIVGKMQEEESVYSLVQEELMRKSQKQNQFLRLNNRLDKPVSGLVILSKASKATSKMNNLIANRQLQKIYFGIVCGKLLLNAVSPVTTIQSQISSSENSSSSSPKWKESASEFEILQYFKDPSSGGDLSLVKINLLTGRKHQIRTQLYSLGYPLYNDDQYGAPYPMGRKHPFPSNAIALHSFSLSFTHPVKKETSDTNEKISLSCSPPDYWRSCFPDLEWSAFQRSSP